MTDKPTVTQADIAAAIQYRMDIRKGFLSSDKSHAEHFAAHREATIKETADHIAALEAENVRLREALTTILDHGYISEYIEEERHDYLIARQALAQQGSEL